MLAIFLVLPPLLEVQTREVHAVDGTDVELLGGIEVLAHRNGGD